jgi:putative transposase
MREYRSMTNDAIRIGVANNNMSNMKKLCGLTCKELKTRYRNIPTCYKLCAISKAVGIILSRNKSTKRGHYSKNPHVREPILVSCYAFKIVNGNLRIPVGKGKCELIPLNTHTLNIPEKEKTVKVRSFTLTATSLSLCIAKEVPEIEEVKGAIGIDRNLLNLAIGNQSQVTYYDMSRLFKIGETTTDVVKSFRRNDVRVRRSIATKYGKRKKNRTHNILNLAPSEIVISSLTQKLTIVFEDIKYIRSMYQKGNHQGKKYSRQMNNNWPFAEMKRQIQYKANWLGIPVIHLTKSKTRGTSSNCCICGKRLQSSGDKSWQLWCRKCENWYDRDLVAVMNISRRG